MQKQRKKVPTSLDLKLIKEFQIVIIWSLENARTSCFHDFCIRVLMNNKHDLTQKQALVRGL